jgi:hypothetical protein
MIRSFNNKSDTLIGDYDTSGFTSTATTILNSITINPGDIVLRDVFTVYAGFEKSGSSIYDITLYHNSASTLTNAVKLGEVTTGSGDTTPTFTRTIFVFDVALLQSLDTTYSSYDDWGYYPAPLVATTINNEIDINTTYLLIAARRTTAATGGITNNFFNVEL